MEKLNDLLNKYFSNSTVETIKLWALSSGLKILIVLILAFTIRKMSHVFIEKLVRRLILTSRHESKIAEKQREDTIINIMQNMTSVLVYVVTGLVILQELGVKIGPIMAAAGIAGLAFGFGGQYLIKDIISGLFITLENQYRVGDVVCFGNTCGLVEGITLRMTSLRDQNGTVYHVPHGEIKTVSNLTKIYARVNLNVRVSYNSNLEKVIETVNKVGQELAEDPKWKEHILKPPQFLRVEDFGDSAMVIKILGDTQPIMQWDVTGELRKRLKEAFDREGIEIPLPQMVVHRERD